jgi:broad specificity phosphatase PhoE
MLEHLRLYLLRHGETQDYEKHLFNGWRDAPLTERGKRQLDRAAEVLQGIPFDAVYSSDLQRARYGGERIARAGGVPLGVTADFREMSFGDCEGLTFSELQDKFPALAEGIMSPQSGRVSFPGGETDLGFFARICRASAELVERHPRGRVLLVSHAGVGRAVLADYLGLSTSSMWALHQDFAGLHVLDIYQNGTYVIRVLNAYLGPEGYAPGSPGYLNLLG